LGDTLYRLFLRAPVALALLPVLGEQRLALLREALFHPFLGLLPQIVLGVAGHRSKPPRG
jgi:hypothetical protein